MGQEEVPVLIVIVGLDFVFGSLCAAGIHRRGFRLLLRNHGRNAQLAELQVCFHTEKARIAGNKASAQRHAHVADFYVFYNVVFFAVILQFKHRLVVVERGFGVVIQSECYAASDRTVHGQLYFLVEVESGRGVL